MILQLLHLHLDRLFQLRVAPLPPRSRIEIDFHIRRDAVVLNFPFSVEAVERGPRCSDKTAVEQFWIAADSHQSAPSSFANQWSDCNFAEVPRQSIATRTGLFVDQHYFGPV